MIARLVVQTLVFGVVLGVALFWPAHTLNWFGGWAFVGLVVALSLGVGLWLAFTNPDLLAERMGSPVRGKQAAWDRVLMSLAGLAFLAWLAGMGWEIGQLGPRTPVWAQAVGAFMLVLCFLGVAAIFSVNTFATPVVEHQSDRQQTVVSTGPYGIIRHPMYSGVLLFFVGAPLLLGSLWGLLFAPAMLPLLVFRTLGEERLLRRELPGYEAYMQRVRARFFPGIW